MICSRFDGELTVSWGENVLYVLDLNGKTALGHPDGFFFVGMKVQRWLPCTQGNEFWMVELNVTEKSKQQLGRSTVNMEMAPSKLEGYTVNGYVDWTEGRG